MQRVQADLPAAAGSRVSGRGGVVVKHIHIGFFEQYERPDRTGLARASAECLIFVVFFVFHSAECSCQFWGWHVSRVLCGLGSFRGMSLGTKNRFCIPRNGLPFRGMLGQRGEGGAGPFAEFRVSLCEGAARWRGSQTLPDCSALHSLARAEKGIQAWANVGRFDAAWVAAFRRWRARGGDQNQ